MRRVAVMLVGSSMALSLAACTQRPIGPTIVTLRITEKDAGKTIKLAEGYRLDIVLDGNPSTGYQWEMVSKKTTVLRQAGDPKFKPQSKEIGAPGKVTLRFLATGPGRAPIELAYRRPWEKGPPLKTYKVNVAVSE